MSSSRDEFGELMALQREAVMPRRKEESSARGETAGAQPGSGGESPDDPGKTGVEGVMEELQEGIQLAVENIEESAREQPALTALVAFSLGVVVGQLFSRR